MTHDPRTPPRRRGRRSIITGLVLLVIGVLPLLSVFLSTVIADAAGCELNEASVNPCVIAGVDVGGALTGMFVSGWLMLVSLPIGAVGLALLLGGLLAGLRRKA